MKILVIDIGGSKVKMLVSGEEVPRKFPSGPLMTPEMMVQGVLEATKDWKYDRLSIGFPSPVVAGRPVCEPVNLGEGWVGFDYEQAFGKPLKFVNDAAMQALGSYEGGKMLFLGLGTGLGTAMVVDGLLQPMELGHLPYKKRSFEDYVGRRGLEKMGTKAWRRAVADVVQTLWKAIEPDYVVLGGGNATKLKELPPGCRLGNNANAFTGGYRLWEEPVKHHGTALTVPAGLETRSAGN